LILRATLSGLFAGLMVMFITRAIEKLGGSIGGVIATVPATIVPAAVGIAIELINNEVALGDALFSMPVGIAFSCIFLYLWRVIPPYIPKSWSFKLKLTLMIVFTESVWLLLACGYIFGLRSARASMEIPFLSITVWLGMLFLISIFCFGLILVCWYPTPSPVGKKHVPLKTLSFRGILSFIVIFTSIVLAPYDEILAGLVAVFPAMETTVMVSLWISQGSSVSSGVVGPMILGMTSVPSYPCILFVALAICRNFFSNEILIIAVSGCVSWLFAILCVTTPIFFIVQCARHNVYETPLGDPGHTLEDEESIALVPQNV